MRIRRHQRNVGEAIRYGRQRLSEDRHQECLEFLEEARKKYPNAAEIQLLYATVLLESRPDDVTAEVIRAVELAAEDPVILVRAASLMFGRGEYQVARSYVERARSVVGPGFVLEGGLVNLEGSFAAFDGAYDLAETKFRSAVELDPSFESFARDLARLLQVRGRQAEAVEVIDRALPQVENKRDLERLREKILGGAAPPSSRRHT